MSVFYCFCSYMVQWRWIMCFAYQSSWPSFMWGDWLGTSLQKCWLFSSFALSSVSSPVSALSSLYGHLYWPSYFIPSPWHWCMFLIMYLVGHRPNNVSYISQCLVWLLSFMGVYDFYRETMLLVTSICGGIINNWERLSGYRLQSFDLSAHYLWVLLDNAALLRLCCEVGSFFILIIQKHVIIFYQFH